MANSIKRAWANAKRAGRRHITKADFNAARYRGSRRKRRGSRRSGRRSGASSMGKTLAKLNKFDDLRRRASIDSATDREEQRKLALLNKSKSVLMSVIGEAEKIETRGLREQEEKKQAEQVLGRLSTGIKNFGSAELVINNATKFPNLAAMYAKDFGQALLMTGFKPGTGPTMAQLAQNMNVVKAEPSASGMVPIVKPEPVFKPETSAPPLGKIDFSN